jgi:hypothetical protein
MKIKRKISLLVILSFFCMPFVSSAQADLPSPGGDPDVPVDGGLSLLLAAGVGYVAKKGYQKRQKSAVNDDKN